MSRDSVFITQTSTTRNLKDIMKEKESTETKPPKTKNKTSIKSIKQKISSKLLPEKTKTKKLKEVEGTSSTTAQIIDAFTPTSTSISSQPQSISQAISTTLYFPPITPTENLYPLIDLSAPDPQPHPPSPQIKCGDEVVWYIKDGIILSPFLFMSHHIGIVQSIWENRREKRFDALIHFSDWNPNNLMNGVLTKDERNLCQRILPLDNLCRLDLYLKERDVALLPRNVSPPCTKFLTRLCTLYGARVIIHKIIMEGDFISIRDVEGNVEKIFMDCNSSIFILAQFNLAIPSGIEHSGDCANAQCQKRVAINVSKLTKMIWDKEFKLLSFNVIPVSFKELAQFEVPTSNVETSSIMQKLAWRNTDTLQKNKTSFNIHQPINLPLPLQNVENVDLQPSLNWNAKNPDLSLSFVNATANEKVSKMRIIRDESFVPKNSTTTFLPNEKQTKRESQITSSMKQESIKEPIQVEIKAPIIPTSSASIDPFQSVVENLITFQLISSTNTSPTQSIRFKKPHILAKPILQTQKQNSETVNTSNSTSKPININRSDPVAISKQEVSPPLPPPPSSYRDPQPEDVFFPPPPEEWLREIKENEHKTISTDLKIEKPQKQLLLQEIRQGVPLRKNQKIEIKKENATNPVASMLLRVIQERRSVIHDDESDSEDDSNDDDESWA